MSRRKSPQVVGMIDRRDRYYGQRYIEALVSQVRQERHHERSSRNKTQSG